MRFLSVAAAQSHSLSAHVGDGLLGLHRAADAITAFSYFGIAATLAYLVRRLRQQLPFSDVFVLFGAFIVLCGATHFTSVLLLGESAPRLVVFVSVVTAAVSMLTAVVLPSYIPKVIAFAASAEAARELFGRDRRDQAVKGLQLGLAAKVEALKQVVAECGHFSILPAQQLL